MSIRQRDFVMGSLVVGSVLLSGAQVGAQCRSMNVTLLSHIPLEDFSAPPGGGSDCWGYVSGSGREYALMGLTSSVAVVEVTNPAFPVIVDQVSHTPSTWCDIKVYGDHAYAVNEAGGGLDVIDLCDVDDGIVTLVQRVTEGGLSRSHNLAVDTDSGFLYLCGSNLNGGRLVVFDLSDPADPLLTAQMSSREGEDVHDAQVVTFRDGPYAGKQIAFCANGGVGLDIYDVTDKSNMFRLSRTTYPNLAFSHQCWLSEDRQYLYLNDELDGVNETVIFDVRDLSDPVVGGSSTSGVPATDHNVYVHDGFIFEAQYKAGLRVFDATDPINPVQVGWYDTYPANDNAGTDGAWGVYPFFPSEIVLISDQQSGLFVVRPGPPPLGFDYPDGVPDRIAPPGDSFLVEITARDPAEVDPDSPTLYYDAGGGFVESPMSHLGGDTYEAVFGPVPCGTIVLFYVGARTTGGITVNDPQDAPCEAFEAIAAFEAGVVFADDMEAENGWVVGAKGDDATTGVWTRVDPLGTDAQPDNDHTAEPGAVCFVTGQGPLGGNVGENDVDEGRTTLMSPLLDLDGAENATISYWRWYSNDWTIEDSDEGAAPNEDVLVIDVSNDNGSKWTNVEMIGPTGPGTSGGWILHSFNIADFILPTSEVRIRFIASDEDAPSIVEAGIDDVGVAIVSCEPVVGDLDGDGRVGVADLLILFANWGPCPDCGMPGGECPADLDGDCFVGVADLLILFAHWG